MSFVPGTYFDGFYFSHNGSIVPLNLPGFMSMDVETMRICLQTDARTCFLVHDNNDTKCRDVAVLSALITDVLRARTASATATDVATAVATAVATDVAVAVKAATAVAAFDLMGSKLVIQCISHAAVDAVCKSYGGFIIIDINGALRGTGVVKWFKGELSELSDILNTLVLLPTNTNVSRIYNYLKHLATSVSLDAPFGEGDEVLASNGVADALARVRTAAENALVVAHDVAIANIACGTAAGAGLHVATDASYTDCCDCCDGSCDGR
jgi:hypothetical protein